MTTLERIPSDVAAPTSTVADVMSLARESGVLIVDLRFVDLPGPGQHFSIPVKELGEDLFIDGIGFDGSSIRGFQHIHESDMLLMPDPRTAFVDPTLEVPTLAVMCDVVEPGSREPYSRDPRYVAKKAERFLVSSGIATTSYWGPEIEFYIFNSLRFDTAGHRSMYEIDSEEGIWNSGPQRDRQPGPPAAPQGGLLPGPAPGQTPGSALARWSSPCRRPGSTSRSSTTRSVDPVRPRSTSASGRWSRPPTRSSSTSTSSARPPPRTVTS